MRKPNARRGAADHDCARARFDRVQVEQPAHPAAEHDAGQVVVPEDSGVFVTAGRDDQTFGAQVNQPFALHHAEQPALVAAEHGGRGQHFDVGLRTDALAQTLPQCITGDIGVRLGRCVAGSDVKPQMATECGLVVDQGDVTAKLRGFVRGVEPRRPSAHDGHVRMPVFMVIAAFGRCLRIQAAQPGDATQQFFGQRPRPTRTNERLVVEADGQQKIEFLDQRQRVETERRPGVLGTDAHARTDRLGTRAHARGAVHVHQAVGAVAGPAQQPARPVILEAAAENALPRGVQRRSDGIARLGADAAAVARERQPPVVIDDVMRPRGESGQFHAVGRRTGLRPGVLGVGYVTGKEGDSRRGVVRVAQFDDRIGTRVAHADQPAPAAEPVKPPLGLFAGYVVPHVQVVRPLPRRYRTVRSMVHLAAGAKFVHAALAAVRTRQQERHGRQPRAGAAQPGPPPKTTLVPANGTPAIIDDSKVSARRSSGSSACTSDLPQARASI